MAEKTWVVTDTAHNIHGDDLSIDSRVLPVHGGDYALRNRILRGGRQDGVQVIEINNGAITLVVVPTRGMGIWRADCQDIRLGWDSPVRGPVHPQWVPLGEPSGLGWLDGFDEFVVRCGLESNGAPDFNGHGALVYPLHGRIANRPAHYVSLHVDPEQGEIIVRGVVEESRFHFAKWRMTSSLRMKVGQPSFSLSDTVENFSASESSMQMLYHINFGAPLAEPGSKLVAPAKQVVPRNDHAARDVAAWDQYGPTEVGGAERVYFLENHAQSDGRTRTVLVNAKGDRGASVLYNVKQLPCFSLWKNTVGTADGYVTGLEPGTNYPNPRTFEHAHGRCPKVAGGASISFDLTIEAHRSAEEVRRATDDAQRLQASPVSVSSAPSAEWCAG
ncbi:MAG: aldose 1-epimerase family protein [Planctomycetales bacterium]|nr:aldose 1-epimerase family protein [Planctomycetales bacterium]